MLPSLIAITFMPSGSQNHVDAVLVDICERLVRERKLSRESRALLEQRYSNAIGNHRGSCEPWRSDKRLNEASLGRQMGAAAAAPGDAAAAAGSAASSATSELGSTLAAGAQSRISPLDVPAAAAPSASPDGPGAAQDRTAEPEVADV